MRLRGAWRRFGLIAILFLALPFCRPALGSGMDAGVVFRIRGVVVSSRDGAPVARCRISAEATGAAVVSQPNRVGRAPQRPGSGQGGRGAGVRGGGFGKGEGSSSQAGSESAITDVGGNFSLTVPHAGMWRVTGAARGFHSQSYDEHEGYTSAVVLTAAAPEMTLSFRMNPDATISGIVFDEAGEPVRQAQVRVELLTPGTPGRPPANQVTGFSQTDDRGHYEVTGLNAGAYRLGVQARPWYATGSGGRVGMVFGSGGSVRSDASPSSLDPSLDVVYPATWFPAAQDADSAETILLKPGEERQADVHVTPMPAVHLKIPRTDIGDSDGDRPRDVRAPIVSSLSGFGMFLGPAQTTGSANEWDMGGLAPGTYQVRLPGSSANLVQLKITAGSAAVVGLEDATPSVKVSVMIDGVPDRASNRVLLTDVETGQIYSSNGVRTGRSPHQLDDDGDGEDAAAGQARTVLVPSRWYEVSLVGPKDLFVTGLDATGAKVTGSLVDIGGGTPTLTVHAAAGRAELKGIASLGGKPAAGAMVLLIPSTYGQPGSVAEVGRDQSNTDGSFVLENMIPGQYILVAIDHGWGVNWHDPATLDRYLAAGTPVQLRASAHEHLEIEAAAP